jgi:hypothetical protein
LWKTIKGMHWGTYRTAVGFGKITDYQTRTRARGKRSRRCPQACDRAASKRFTDLAPFVAGRTHFCEVVAADLATTIPGANGKRSRPPHPRTRRSLYPPIHPAHANFQLRLRGYGDMVSVANQLSSPWFFTNPTCWRQRTG